MTNLLAVLPMATVMIAGPHVISAVLLTTSENVWRDGPVSTASSRSAKDNRSKDRVRAGGASRARTFT